MLAIILGSAEGAVSNITATFLGLDPATWMGLGGAVGGLVAGLMGLRKGTEDKHHTPQDPAFSVIGSAIVDSQTLLRLVVAVDNLTDAIRDNQEAGERRAKDDTARTIAELAHRIDEKIPAPKPPRGG
jgi:hypothetical protein